MALFGDLIAKVGADVGDFLAGMDLVNEKLGQVDKEFASKTSGFDALGGRLTSAGTALSIGVTAPLAAIGGLGVNAFANLEALSKGLEVVAGGAGPAAEQLERLKEIAKLPGLGFQEAVQGAVNLQSVGYSAEQAEQMLRVFGNALATVGRGREDLNGVIVQLQQMSGKTKVLSEDIKPLIQRVPQMAAAMKDLYGTLDTEALQKMGVAPQKFIQDIINELAKLPPVAGGLKNDLENVKDAVSFMLAEVGKALAPFVASIINVAVPALQSMTEWFSNLSPKMQTTIVAFAATVAAIGPLLLISGQLITAITNVAGAFGALKAGMSAASALMPSMATGLSSLASGAASAIGALGTGSGLTGILGALISPVGIAVAAIAALAGVAYLVYTNWEDVKATLTAWWTDLWNLATSAAEGMKSVTLAAWGAIGDAAQFIFGPMIQLLAPLWDALAKAWPVVWGALKDFLSGVWTAIADIAKGIWDWIVNKINWALDQLAKIMPNTVQALRDWGKHSKDAAEGASDLSKETDKLKKAADAAHKPILNLGDAAKKGEDKHKKFDKQLLETTTSVNKAKKEYEEAAERHQEWIDSYDDHIFEAESLRIALTDMGQAVYDLSKIKLPEAMTALAAMKTESGDLNKAFETLGVRSTTDFETVAREARKAYDVVVGSGIATDYEKNAALVVVMEAEIAAAKAAGREVPAEHLAMLEKLKSDTDLKLPSIKGAWDDFGNEVSTIITNTAQNMAKSLFDGDLSWGEKVKSMLKDLGTAAVSTFITPFTDAIAKFVSGALSDLLGGKGLGGLLDKLKSVGSAVSGLFGAGGSAAAGYIGTGEEFAGAAAGAAGGAANVASGAASSAMSWGQSLATGGIAAVGSILGGIITGAMMGGDLGKIEENTRFTKDGIGAPGGVIDQTARAANILSDFSSYVGTAQRDILMGIADYTYGTAERTLELLHEVRKFADDSARIVFENCTFGTSKVDTEAAVSTALKQAYAG